MIREGISLYGYPPVPTGLDFRHVLRWESEVVYVKELCAGCSIGYGCTYTTVSPHAALPQSLLAMATDITA